MVRVNEVGERAALQVGEPGVEGEDGDTGGEGVEAELEVAGGCVGRAAQQAAGRCAAVEQRGLLLWPSAAGVPQRIHDGVVHYAVRLATLGLHRLERLRRIPPNIISAAGFHVDGRALSCLVRRTIPCANRGSQTTV